MPVYRHGVASAAAAAGAAYWSFNSATRRARIREINITLRTAIESEVSLGTPANEATPPVATALTPLGAAADIAATARVGVAWSTAPTTPAAFAYSTLLGAVKGAAWVWKWAPDEYEEVKLAGWRVLWNSSASLAGQLLVNVLYDE